MFTNDPSMAQYVSVPADGSPLTRANPMRATPSMTPRLYGNYQQYLLQQRMATLQETSQTPPLVGAIPLHRQGWQQAGYYPPAVEGGEPQAAALVLTQTPQHQGFAMQRVVNMSALTRGAESRMFPMFPSVGAQYPQSGRVRAAVPPRAVPAVVVPASAPATVSFDDSAYAAATTAFASKPPRRRRPRGRKYSEVLSSPHESSGYLTSESHDSYDDSYDSYSSSSTGSTESSGYFPDSSRFSSEVELQPAPKASLVNQLLATVDREFQGLTRKPWSLVMDVVIPLLFVIVTVVLWLVWGSEGTDNRSLINYQDPMFNVSSSTTPTTAGVFCNDRDSGVTIPGIAPCVRDTDHPFTCDGDERYMPYGNGSFCTYLPSFRHAMGSFLAETYGQLSLIPSLDTIIEYKWAGLKTGNAIESSSFSGSFHSNRQPFAMQIMGRIIFAGPDRVVLERLVAYLDNTSLLFPTVYGGIVAGMDEARDRVKDVERDGHSVWAVVEVRAMDATAFDVALHMSPRGLPDTAITVDTQYPGGVIWNGAQLYLASGFLTLQVAVSSHYLARYLDADLQVENFIVPSNYPEYSFSPMLQGAYQLIPLILVMSFLYPVTKQVKKIVLVKETRIREAMLIMGMKDSALYLANFIVPFCTLFVVCAGASTMVKATFLDKVDIWITLLVFILFALTIIPLAGLIASLFSKTRLASLMAPVIYFILVIPPFIMGSSRGPAVLGFSVFSPSAFASAVTILLQNQLGDGFGADDFSNVYDDPQLWKLIVIMAADFVIYYLLMLYLDAVLPRDWGTTKHPLFFIIDPFKACCCRGTMVLEGGPDGRAVDGCFEEGDYADNVVQMIGLRKEYSRGGKTFTAVDNLYWGMREGEISVMLGHNGAGKTTVLNMMTGMIEPDQGDCVIFGLSVRQELSLVRNEVGFCPQQNILWPELTCRDHLEFYGRIKGLKSWELEDAVCRMLHETALLDKADCKSRDLSGGQKRKLSVAIAFVGGGRLVFLDEPTAGMDVGARRHLWELLKNMSYYHTIMLTTHYMDEADLLGHRIGIMSHGSLKCSGSSLFLKSNLGTGYSIAISIVPGTNADAVDELVVSNVNGAEALSHNGCELSYQLPMESVLEFPAMLLALETQTAEFGIRGYSLSATTLEEVFLKVSEHDLDGRDEQAKASIAPVWEAPRVKSVCIEQIRAMFVKRFWNALRDRRMQCFQIVCPVLCILIAMLLALIKVSKPERLELTYANLFAVDPQTPELFTSQCQDWFGPDAAVPGAALLETHYPNAEQLSDFFSDGWRSHDNPRYGGIACQDRALARAAAQSWGRTPIANVHIFNGSSPHQTPLSIATYYHLVAQRAAGRPVDMKWFSGTLNTDEGDVVDPFRMLITAILIMIPFTFLPSNPVAWIVKERECGAMHQQDLAGLNFYVYWGCNFVFDLVAYLISMFLVIAVFGFFSRDEFISSNRVGATISLFGLYGITSTAMAYALSFAFSEHTSAQMAVMAGNFVFSFLLLIVLYVLALKAETEDISETLRWVFRMVPGFALGEGVTNLMLQDQLQASGTSKSIWDLNKMSGTVIMLAVEFPFFVVLTILLGSPKIRMCFQLRSYNRDHPPTLDSEEDSDVEEEREAVYRAESKGGYPTDIIRVVDLQKTFPNGKKAVKGVTFSIFPNEVFAFLGTNGAGKTTTMSMLCQQFAPTGGSARVSGYDIVDDSRAALLSLGYCPQFDATFDLLTVQEHLEYYAALHGIVREWRGRVIDTLLNLCELTVYRETLAHELSGGNRRKLSVAMSLVGGPQVILLDEPSAGMDPVARRGMWTTIQCAADHCSIVLTTHHLEEVEALADVVAIMVDGSLRCLGDKVHLKNKYGSGFEFSAKIASEEYREGVEQFIAEHFPNATLNEFKSNRFVFELPSDASLSEVFEIVQRSKEELGITDYCVSQTSIEQVFLRIGAGAL